MIVNIRKNLILYLLSDPSSKDPQQSPIFRRVNNLYNLNLNTDEDYWGLISRLSITFYDSNLRYPGENKQVWNRTITQKKSLTDYLLLLSIKFINSQIIE